MINVPCSNCDNNATSKKFMEIANSTVLAGSMLEHKCLRNEILLSTWHKGGGGGGEREGREEHFSDSCGKGHSLMKISSTTLS